MTGWWAAVLFLCVVYVWCGGLGFGAAGDFSGGVVCTPLCRELEVVPALFFQKRDGCHVHPSYLGLFHVICLLRFPAVHALGRGLRL
ncbi:hypothetical protein HNR53_004293 [Bacillus benzoevorans]|uniref:Uncharacterized protein n=1 Tax=Bacillus benzoevorans TaxID=1456 RepID=A0A7X0HVF0_9BACI|nr:hypothetical protein [Bacillus benzoevorans]